MNIACLEPGGLGTPLPSRIANIMQKNNRPELNLDEDIPGGQFVAVAGRSGGAAKSEPRRAPGWRGSGVLPKPQGDAGRVPHRHEIQEDTRTCFLHARLAMRKSHRHRRAGALKASARRARAGRAPGWLAAGPECARGMARRFPAGRKRAALGKRLAR